MTLPNSSSAATRPPTANVVLVGMMGSGKSSIGKRVAEGMGLTFVDTDERIVEMAGCSIPDIFDLEGEDGFRRRERAALQEMTPLRNHVIATGGGIILSKENRRTLRGLGYVIWLTASLDCLLFRVSQTRERPLVLTDDPRQRLADLMEQREALYDEVADLVVDTTELTMCETVHGLIESVNYHFGCRCEGA